MIYNASNYYIDKDGRTRSKGVKTMDRAEELKTLLEDIVERKLSERAQPPMKARGMMDITSPGDKTIDYGPEGDTRNPVIGKVIQGLYRLQQGDTSAYTDLKNMGARKALQEDDSAEGGYLVPVSYLADVLRIPERSGLEAFCRKIPMTSKQKQYPDLSSSTSASWKSEEAALDLSEPVLGTITLTAQKVGSYVISSNELLEDASIDVIDFLQTLFLEAMGKEIDSQILQGTGSPCSGILTAACGYSVVMGSGLTNFSSITGSHLSEMISKLPAAALPGSRFVMHQTVFHHVRTLKDTNNQFIYSPIGGSQNGSIWGYPVHVSDGAPSTSAANTAFVGFGNFSYFLLGDRLAFSLGTDPYTKFLEYQTRIRWLRRLALQIGKSTAFCRLLTAS